jgi:hypothetical protein
VPSAFHRAALAAVLAGAIAATAAAATPRWQDVPGAKADDHVVIWGGGRVWFANNSTSGAPRFTIRSARVAGGRLGSWATAGVDGVRPTDFEAVLGDELVFQTSLTTPPLAVQLLPNGTLGRPVQLGGAPPPPSSSGTIVVRLPDRSVELVNANRSATNLVPHLGACCDVNGQVVDYASIARPGIRPLGKLGLDRHGRLWLAWAPGFISRNPAEIVELDPATLQPLGAPTAVPVLTLVQIVELGCADACRLVLTGGVPKTDHRLPRTTTTFSWAPGEALPTPIALPDAPDGFLVAARVSNGSLDVAYDAHAADGELKAVVARGDARGAHLRRVSSISVPQFLAGGVARGVALTIGPLGAFGPGAFAAVTVYEGGPSTGGGAHVRVAVLPACG